MQLWIAYNLYLWNIECSPMVSSIAACRVVNCLQFVSLKYWMQRRGSKCYRTASCELLTICIFEILNAAIVRNRQNRRMLWIAYNLYLWNIECSNWWNRLDEQTVVNCLQFVSLKYWMQQKSYSNLATRRCELLTICIFEILNAAKAISRFSMSLLWIAYNLYLWNIECS